MSRVLKYSQIPHIIGLMNVIIPETLQKKVRKHAQKSGVSETQYIHTAIKQAIAAGDSLRDEMALWELSSLQDFDRFAKKRKA